MRKYSKQRESIKSYLSTHCNHPTAETIYLAIKEEFPNISLGTVYRNLALLEESGEVLKISMGSGPDRYDGCVDPHYHFFCTECGQVSDLEMERIDHINVIAGHNFGGTIDGNMTYFYGKCPECAKKIKKENLPKTS